MQPALRRCFRALAIASGLTTLITLAVVGWALDAVNRAQAQDIIPGTMDGGTVALIGDLPVLTLSGDAATRGRQQGHLTGAQARHLLALMRFQPRLLVNRHRETFQRTLAAIAPEDRAEITALADAAGIDRDDLLAANAMVDAQCSALVLPASATRPLMVGRNMDFFPARALGPATTLIIQRNAGPRAYAAVGWPGAVGVISGINDAGLSACILLNHNAPPATGGEPLALRVRRILAEESDVAGALRRYRAAAVGMGHFVLLADAQDAAVVWTAADGVHEDHLGRQWLTASNGLRDSGQAADTRGQRLCSLAAAGAATGDDAWLRQALTASYMKGINAQAMVIIPATLHLQLARGTGTHPAAAAEYRDLDLGPLLAGNGMPTEQRLPAAIPLQHYSE